MGNERETNAGKPVGGYYVAGSDFVDGYREEMEAFDSLPQELRDALNTNHHMFSAKQVVEMIGTGEETQATILFKLRAISEKERRKEKALQVDMEQWLKERYP